MKVTQRELRDAENRRVILWRDNKGNIQLMVLEEAGSLYTAYQRTGTGYQWIVQQYDFEQLMREFREWMEAASFEEAA